MSFIAQDALELIPQRTPFVFVDRLTFIDEHTSHGSFKIPEENIFVKSGVFTTSGMVESMAQTAAKEMILKPECFSGENKKIEGNKPK